VGHAEPFGGGFFEGSDRLAEDKLLCLKDMAESLKQFVVERAILTFEVQHGDGLGHRGGAFRRVRCGVHNPMLPALRFPQSEKLFQKPAMGEKIV
jgi:hypothetical protein